MLYFCKVTFSWFANTGISYRVLNSCEDDAATPSPCSHCSYCSCYLTLAPPPQNQKVATTLSLPYFRCIHLKEPLFQRCPALTSSLRSEVWDSSVMFCRVLCKLLAGLWHAGADINQAGIRAKLGLLWGGKELASNAMQAKIAHMRVAPGCGAKLAREEVRLVLVIPLCEASSSGGACKGAGGRRSSPIIILLYHCESRKRIWLQ